MNSQQSRKINNMWQRLIILLSMSLLLLHNIHIVNAATVSLSAIQIDALADNKLQIQLEMDGAAVTPKVFHTDSPARIALDFLAVKNALNKKIVPVNQANVNSIYIVEAADKMRVVVNLLAVTPFETKVLGNKVILLLNTAKPVAALTTEKTVAPKTIDSNSTQAIKPVATTPITTSSNTVTLSAIHVDALAGDKLQIQLDMSGSITEPEIFRTDNPARITLDFPAVKNALNKRIVPVNQGTVNSVYLVETADRLRVVINLLESMAFETKVITNKVIITLSNNGNSSMAKTVLNKTTAPLTATRPIANGIKTNAAITANHYPLSTQLMPEQAINGFDFKRGDNGEGRLMVSLASANTIVNSKEESGKIVLSFINTRLPDHLTKRLDFSEFATPVKYIEAAASTKEATVTITTQNKLYDYSLFQSDGLLTVEFRPLSDQEKETLDKSRVKYTGERLSLNFQDIEIRSVIAILAEFTGQNVVAGDDVVGTITLKLDDVPWDEALDFVMMTKGLGKFETGNVTLISPLEKIKDYKKKQQETEAVVAELDPIITEYIKINYAKANDFRNLLKGADVRTFGSCGSNQDNASSGTESSGSSVSSSSSSDTSSSSSQQNQSGSKNTVINSSALISVRGSVVVDARTNTLIVRETAKRLEEIKKLVRRLDVPVRQVMIEARIVIASNNFIKDLGVKFGGNGSSAAGANSFFGLGGKDIRSVPTTADYSDPVDPKITPAHMLLPTDTTSGQLKDMLVDLGALNPYGALSMTLVRGADYVLNLELSALQRQNLGELISNPRVMTSDRCQAVIKQGVQIPYQTSSGNTGIKVSFKEAVLALGVTPQITPNGSIIMDLNIAKDNVGEMFSGIPSIDTRSLATTVLVNDGETIVLGGIYEGDNSDIKYKIPFFGDLPGIGFLFTRTTKQDNKKELLIFITPKIAKDNAAISGS